MQKGKERLYMLDLLEDNVEVYAIWKWPNPYWFLH